MAVAGDSIRIREVVRAFALPSRFVRGPSQSRFLSLNRLFHHAIMHRDPEVWFLLSLVHIYPFISAYCCSWAVRVPQG
jgi:hypothetical protein